MRCGLSDRKAVGGLTFSARGRTSFQSITMYTSSTSALPVRLKRSFSAWPSDFVMKADGMVMFLRYLSRAETVQQSSILPLVSQQGPLLFTSMPAKDKCSWNERQIVTHL